MRDNAPVGSSNAAPPSRADFTRVAEAHRRALKLHCYRMLGSLHEAEDAVQETMLRAWRGFDDFEARASIKNWLYRIATNVALNTASRSNHRRTMPDQLDGPSIQRPQGRPDSEAQWIEPYPDAELESLPDPAAGPDVRYELRESVRFAFITAIQQLPARQRAVLLLADVLGWSAIEVAAVLDASVASVNSALQRARARLATLDGDARQAPIADDQQRSLLKRYVQAWESADLERFVSLLKEDAVYSMPPWREWYRGRTSIADFFRAVWPAYRGFRLVSVGANLQPAFALYSLGAEGCWNAHSIQLLALDESGIGAMTMFMQPLAQKLFTAFRLPAVLEP
ncbi:RNA polymerase subunit sigma-70 [uncultured Bradyrhizobium sp.]|jgi:RNA polymerase sigma-70 factor (ECF subfamily)|uniref:RNA polymerase subunit sigma-70 n=1 Tax=uncultured Bradyrhizobium sp. TaxID=199684 RepID=UPI0026073FF5|nr:RNA polymerase subunit sigma-70 [uncultured Bradyrhizobium sp.]